ncbi:ABC transporter ATP-binding protein [Veronia nyctiphanis]|uniref:ABC transporter ATP-binding protein n=1 Tax=Veronia nyctiphanis TaxID=1278244 RepID=UPI001F3E1DE5
MVREPAAFLFDEPLSNLDAKLRVEMRAEISQLHQQLGTTFIYVTHDQAEAMTMSDRIAVMMEGEIVQIGSPDDLYHQPKDIRVARFIGSPPMNLLNAEIVSNTLMLLSQQRRIESELSDGHVQVGIRSEDIFLVETVEHPKPDFITHGIITHIENLGAEYYLTLNNENSHHSSITLRLPYQQAKGKQRGQRVHVGFMLSHCHVFNEQGKRTDVHQTPLEVVHG